jgi:hypothetical protein
MRLLPVVAILLLSSTAFSSVKKSFSLVPRSGEYTCSRLGDLKYDCLDLIKYRFVDEWASGALDRYTSPKDTLDGMGIIVDRHFQYEAVIACDRFVSSTDTTQCLQATRDCTYTEEAISSCDSETTLSMTVRCFRYYCNK